MAKRPGPFLLAVAGLALQVGCHTSPRVEERVVTVHAPSACPLDAAAFGVLFARGDFEPTVDPASSGKLVDSLGAPLAGIPASSRALVLDALSPGVDRPFRGVAVMAATGPIDLVAWPWRAPCPLTPTLGERAGATLAVLDDRRALVVGGRGASRTPPAFLADLATGAVRELATGLLTPRVAPSVTVFGDGALVAGGRVQDGGRPLDTAEVFDGAAGDFDGAPIALGEARADHGAVTLASGETLLAGGTGAAGEPLASLVVIDPRSRRARSQGLVQLATPRSRPHVVRLASGEVLVAGGFDAQGVPVSTLEWLTPDASAASRRSRDLVVASSHAFVALPAGGAIAVFASGPPSGTLNAWLVRPDGALEDLAPVSGLTAVRLFPGSQGAPILWTGDRWLRFRPWVGDFTALDDAAAAGPEPDATLASTSSVSLADPGLALWLGRPGGGPARLHGFRFDTRVAFAAHPSALALGDTTFLAPDRVPGGDLRFDARAGLELAPGATVVVTDATFASVEIALEAPTGAPPDVVLRDSRGVESVCGLPSSPGAGTAHVIRVAGAVEASVDGGVAIACPGVDPAARVSVLLRGAATRPTSVARGLVLTRRGGLP